MSEAYRRCRCRSLLEQHGNVGHLCMFICMLICMFICMYERHTAILTIIESCETASNDFQYRFYYWKTVVNLKQTLSYYENSSRSVTRGSRECRCGCFTYIHVHITHSKPELFFLFPRKVFLALKYLGKRRKKLWLITYAYTYFNTYTYAYAYTYFKTYTYAYAYRYSRFFCC